MNVISYYYPKITICWFLKISIIIAIVCTSSFPQFISTTLSSPNSEFQGDFGYAVSNAGDVNNDGYDDVIIGANYEDAIYTDDGRVYIFSGFDGDLLFTITSPNPVISGSFGSSVSDAGDINNDGFDDVIVGAQFESGGVSYSGKVYIISGYDGTVLRTILSPNPSTSGDFGFSVSKLDDINNDQVPEILVGARRENNWFGLAYIFSGTDGTLLQTLTSGYTTGGVGFFGYSISGIDDINNDNKDDVIVGAAEENGGASLSGRVHVFSGNDGTLLFTIVSPYPLDLGGFGISVSTAGDVNNDNAEDIIVGARNESSGPLKSGRAYIFSGMNGEILYELTSPNPEQNGFFGISVSDAGDLNSDEYDDVIVGAFWEDGGATNAGRAYIFSGKDGTVINTLISANPESGGFFGYSVSIAGDVNKDSYSDFVIGAISENGGGTDGGRAYIFATDSPVFNNQFAPISERNYFLKQNYPNPFNPITTIEYQIVEGSFVRIKVFDVLGNEVATLVNEEKSAGTYEVEFNISNLQNGISAKGGYASGVYFYTLNAGSFTQTKKLILMK